MKNTSCYSLIFYCVYFYLLVIYSNVRPSDQITEAEPIPNLASFLQEIETNVSMGFNRCYDRNYNYYYVFKEVSIEKRPSLKKDDRFSPFYDEYILPCAPKRMAINKARTLLLVIGYHVHYRCSVVSLATGNHLILKGHGFFDDLRRIKYGFVPNSDTIVIEDIFCRNEWNLTQSDKKKLFDYSD